MCLPEILSFYRTEKISAGNVLQKSMSKGDMNPVMYGILKMVEYKVQIITYSCVRCPNSAFDGERYRCGF